MNGTMEQVMEYWPVVMPLLLLEIIVLVIALLHIFRHQNYRIGNRVIWVIVCLIFPMIGSLVYLVLGREEE